VGLRPSVPRKLIDIHSQGRIKMSRYYILRIFIPFLLILGCSNISNTAPPDKEVVDQVRIALEELLNDGLFKVTDVKKVNGYKKGESYFAIIEYDMANEYSLSQMKKISDKAYKAKDFLTAGKVISLEQRYGNFNVGEIVHSWQLECEFVKSEKGWMMNRVDANQMKQLK